MEPYLKIHNHCYRADEMLQILKARGIASAMVAVAGDVRLGAPPPGRAGWSVGIRTLGADIEQIIQVSNCAVSTSGDLERYVEIGGTRYSHIIDPGTGLGLTRRIAATVVAPVPTLFSRTRRPSLEFLIFW